MEQKEKCDICKKEDFLKEIGDYYLVCKSCLEDRTKICKHCNTYFPEDNVDENGIFSIGKDGDDYICEECIDNPESGVVICDGEYCTHDIIYESDSVNVGQKSYCEDCYNYIKETSSINHLVDDPDHAEHVMEALWDKD
ncbi:hypothetical protein [Clostridium botulinum]|uniref:hypothetical protein n=1 Tax=Clostridium botulinum TaxID=1491 RepID=UPI000773DE14|nr:hypothetical protein [Clostridium botulinum]